MGADNGEIRALLRTDSNLAACRSGPAQPAIAAGPGGAGSGAACAKGSAAWAVLQAMSHCQTHTPCQTAPRAPSPTSPLRHVRTPPLTLLRSAPLAPLAGALVFDPANITIAKGESVTFVNNAGFPHNVVFDEDDVPVSLCAAFSCCCLAAVALCSCGLARSTCCAVLSAWTDSPKGCEAAAQHCSWQPGAGQRSCGSTLVCPGAAAAWRCSAARRRSLAAALHCVKQPATPPGMRCQGRTAPTSSPNTLSPAWHKRSPRRLHLSLLTCVQAGVNAEAISREDYLNAPGEEFTVKLDAGECSGGALLTGGVLWKLLGPSLLVEQAGGAHPC